MIWDDVQRAAKHVGAARCVFYANGAETVFLVKFLFRRGPDLDNQLQRCKDLRTVAAEGTRIVVRYQVMSAAELDAMDALRRLHGERAAITVMCGDPEEDLR